MALVSWFLDLIDGLELKNQMFLVNFRRSVLSGDKNGWALLVEVFFTILLHMG